MKIVWILFLVMSGVGGPLLSPAQDYLAVADKDHEKKTVKEQKTGNIPEVVTAYRWEFWSALPPEGEKTQTLSSRNTDFGQEVDNLLFLLDEYYIKKEQILEGDPTLRMVIRKPAIYQAVKNIGKYYKRLMKNRGEEEINSEDYLYALQVAIAAVDSENTEAFEEELQKKRKDVREQIRIFKQVKLNSIY